MFRFAEAAFDGYFGNRMNLDEPEVLIRIADGCGMDGAALVARTDDDDIKSRLRANTQSVIDRGGFGSPTMFVDGAEMYFGNDQLPIVRLALQVAGS